MEKLLEHHGELVSLDELGALDGGFTLLIKNLVRSNFRIDFFMTPTQVSLLRCGISRGKRERFLQR